MAVQYQTVFGLETGPLSGPETVLGLGWTGGEMEHEKGRRHLLLFLLFLLLLLLLWASWRERTEPREGRQPRPETAPAGREAHLCRTEENSRIRQYKTDKQMDWSE